MKNDNTLLIIFGVGALGLAGYYMYSQAQAQQAQLIAMQNQQQNDGGGLGSLLGIISPLLALL
jgi:hypothetical protein